MSIPGIRITGYNASGLPILATAEIKRDPRRCSACGNAIGADAADGRCGSCITRFHQAEIVGMVAGNAERVALGLVGHRRQ